MCSDREAGLVEGGGRAGREVVWGRGRRRAGRGLHKCSLAPSEAAESDCLILSGNTASHTLLPKPQAWAGTACSLQKPQEAGGERRGSSRGASDPAPAPGPCSPPRPPARRQVQTRALARVSGWDLRARLPPPRPPVQGAPPAMPLALYNSAKLEASTR